MRAVNHEEARTAPPSKAYEILFDYIRDPEFKRLLNQIVVAQERKKFKSIAVLSQLPEEGKTFMISVLALGYATYLRKRVLIMDTVSQTQNESFYVGRVLDREQDKKGHGKNAYGGIIDLITTVNLQQRTALPFGASKHPTLRIVDPPALYEETRGYDSTDFQVGPFMDTMAPNYDLVLLDTCSLTANDKTKLDPVILARQSHAALLITSERSLYRESLLRVRDDCSRYNINLLGSIHNPGATL